MSKTQPITESGLRKLGFYKDETAPDGVNRYIHQRKDFQSHFVTVTFKGGYATYIFIRTTNYSPNGALDNTKTWKAEGNTLTEEDLLRGVRETAIAIKGL